MKRLLFVAPHLSTGGLPQYLVKKVELLRDVFDISVVEYSDITGGRLVVQRNRLKSLLKNELITLGEDKFKLIDIIKTLNPDIIHMEEIPEMFCDNYIADQIYTLNRNYAIYETSHDSSFDIHYKRYTPDKMILVSEYQRTLYQPLNIPIEVIDYPIEFISTNNRERYREELGLDPTKKHILNVGLFTPRKNQKEFFEYARALPQYQFHSVGNMADNFQFYWKPLLKDVPNNMKIWDERSDVHKFFEAMDLFLFTSQGSNSDKETMPLVLKEALSAKIPICLYNLDVYEGFFDQFNNIHYLDFKNMTTNNSLIQNILSTAESKYPTQLDNSYLRYKNLVRFSSRWDPEEQRIYFSASDYVEKVRISIREYKSNAVAWSVVYDELASNCEYWILPIPKEVYNYETSNEISGVRLCIYDEETGKQLYEYPYFIKFVDIPHIDLSNSIPYHMNYLEFFVRDKYKRFIEKYDTVVDVGANVGIFTSYLLYKRAANNIIAVECDSRALKDLKNNFYINPAVTVIEKALNVSNEPITLYEVIDNPVTSTTITDSDLQFRNDRLLSIPKLVNSITLEEIVNDFGTIDLLKVDIEGGEYNIFEKVSNHTLNSINNILIECHFFERDYLEKYQRLISKLENCGFVVEEYEIGQSQKAGESEVIFAKRRIR
jgi:FkbM family methyltransferase